MKNYARILVLVFFSIFCLTVQAQVKNSKGEIMAATPPMGWMTWNYFTDKIHEKDLREMADAMVATGMPDGDYAIVILNKTPDVKKFQLNFSELGLAGSMKRRISGLISGVKKRLPGQEI